MSVQTSLYDVNGTEDELVVLNDLSLRLVQNRMLKSLVKTCTIVFVTFLHMNKIVTLVYCVHLSGSYVMYVIGDGETGS